MTWPNDVLRTDHCDSQTDLVEREQFFELFRTAKEILAARGTADGVASLDADGKVPDDQTGRGEAGGVASLDGTTKVPDDQIGRGDANGVASLDANGKVPAGQLNQTAFRSGDVKWTFRADAEDGWTEADGRAVSRVGTYAGVFAAYGTTFGQGDGATTFNLPNVQRRAMIGAGGAGTDVIGSALGDTGGDESHALIVDEMPAHSHDLRVKDNQAQDGSRHGFASSVPFSGGYDADTRYVADAGGGGSHNNVQPSIVARCLIKL